MSTPNPILPESIMQRSLRGALDNDGPAIDEIAHFSARLSDVAIGSYQVHGDAGALVESLSPAIRQDLDCAVTLADSITVVRTFAESDPEDEADDSLLGIWIAVAEDLSTQNLTMLVRALKFEPVSDEPESDIAAVVKLIDYITVTSQSTIDESDIASLYRSIISGAKGISLDRLDSLCSSLVANLAKSMPIGDDEEVNAQFWASLVSEGAEAADNLHRLHARLKLGTSVVNAAKTN